jgi:exodeoxyribonuclease V gamma subunit
MERWLTQRMSERLGASEGRFDGVCANVSFPSPHRLVGEAVASASGIEPDGDPWFPERSLWPLLEVVDPSLGEPWLRGLATYLGCSTDPPDPVRRARRLSVVRHLADLFDRYALHRPEMVAAWARGLDTDANGEPLSEDAAWQPELWRRLRGRIGLPGLAERREEACARLREDAALVDLPERLSLFGLTRLPAGHLHVLEALGERREVHLFLLHPSPALWESVEDATERTPRIVRRHDDPTSELPGNRLLRSWGRDAREMQLVLGERAARVDHHHPLDFRSGTLLGRIQADARADRPAPGAPLPHQPDARVALDPADRSLQVHACHGRARQVEVVRAAILHALAEDPTLEPRDVVVMCPDIETFAPLIEATFGAGEVSRDTDEIETLPAEPRPVDLRVRLADRSLRQTNPVLGVVAELLDLADGRLTASQVLDFADREPVRRRFWFDDDDLTRLQGWIADSGIRWGLDAAHRAPFSLDRVEGGTWRAGLDRLLVGVTMTEDQQRLFGRVLPLDDVESGAIDLVGRFAELVSRLEQLVDGLSAPKTVDAWADAIGAGADSLAATRERDAWQRAELQRLLDGLVGDATVDNAVTPTRLALSEIRALLAEQLQGRPTRANFRTGHLTICTLVPMRSVPHRVVCLLGLDDGAFPRKAPRDGDDLMLADPRVGERDPRTEDRQLLLDALLAATERLIITYTGNDERTNAPQPPAVPVGELLDIVDATARANDGPARAQVLVRHPLQPFDPRNFSPDQLTGDGPWSFDRVTLEGARALIGPRSDPGPFLAAPLPALDTNLIEVDDLVRFVQHPVKAFLRQRLRISLSEFADETEDSLRLELDALQSWAIGQRLVDALMAGGEGRTAYLAEIARGDLPPGVLGKPLLDELYTTADTIVQEAGPLAPGDAPGAPVDVRVTLPDGSRLGGSVAGVRGEVLLTTTYSRVAAKQRLAAWVRLLALTAADPERAFSAATVGRARGHPTVTVARIAPLGTAADARRRAAHDQLSVLVDLYMRGMREPLPLYCRTSAAYAEAAAAGGDPVRAGSGTWTSSRNYSGEDGELEHQLVLGEVSRFDDLLAEPPQPDEQGPGWQPRETTRLGRYARRLWDGLLAREEVTSP